MVSGSINHRAHLVQSWSEQVLDQSSRAKASAGKVWVGAEVSPQASSG